ncbi:hypothetical protein Verru16b_03202 [Lacunisphaera limnophila]|uniref:Uncharacterized protein n=1 Tax=Lacunisphaera limnophila TaxID=1838286 RepID=A0A1D8AYZ1_9BACT|nr:hypothetical protein Verru16b_03202 [Lacunisphaera limnophila]
MGKIDIELWTTIFSVLRKDVPRSERYDIIAFLAHTEKLGMLASNLPPMCCRRRNTLKFFL